MAEKNWNLQKEMTSWIKTLSTGGQPKTHLAAKVRCAERNLREFLQITRSLSFALAFRKIFGLFTFGLPGASLIQPLFLPGV